MPRTLYRAATRTAPSSASARQTERATPATSTGSMLEQLHKLEINQLEQYLRSAGWLNLESGESSSLWGRAQDDDSGITLRIPKNDAQADRDELVFHAICFIVAHEHGLKAPNHSRSMSNTEMAIGFADTKMPLSMAPAFEMGVRFALGQPNS